MRLVFQTHEEAICTHFSLKHEEKVRAMYAEMEGSVDNEAEQVESVKLIYSFGKVLFNSLALLKAFELFDQVIEMGKNSDIVAIQRLGIKATFKKVKGYQLSSELVIN